jgi:hypothetical protein
MQDLETLMLRQAAKHSELSLGTLMALVVVARGIYQL